MTAGWDACQGSPRDYDNKEVGTRKLPDGSWILSNHRGQEIRIAAKDVDKLIAMLSGATEVVREVTINIETYPAWRTE